ncbi:hypothetical protein ABW20_dc0105209 [Dactylellina cionopaga]|nr:hypothetical protein ABW20_dc0105209 [Dactylellina cionopaga]
MEMGRNILLDMDVETMGEVGSDISWMLDTDLKIVWAWEYRRVRWGHLDIAGGVFLPADGVLNDGAEKTEGKGKEEDGEERKKRKKVKEMLKKLKL